MLATVAFAPASYPARNATTAGTAWPPTALTAPPSATVAAATPTR